jgi:hypothetical protein
MRNRTPREILSHRRKLLRLLTDSGADDRQEISKASPVRKGEQYMKYTVHYFVHLPVHSDSGASEREKGNCAREATVFGRRTGAMWAGATPPLVHAACPTVAWSRSSPHVCGEGRFVEANMKCMSQPRVRNCNSEAVRV